MFGKTEASVRRRPWVRLGHAPTTIYALPIPTMDNLKDKLTGAATNLGESASGVADDLQSRAKDAWDSVQDQS